MFFTTSLFGDSLHTFGSSIPGSGAKLMNIFALFCSLMFCDVSLGAEAEISNLLRHWKFFYKISIYI